MNILDFHARAHTPCLHARGRRGTGVLLESLDRVDAGNILELGFGTGQTLVDVAVRKPECALFGVEKSEIMLKVAEKRLKFCRLGKIRLIPADDGGRLPFPDHFFDAAYAESVLAFLPERDISRAMSEIFRVLKNGGVFLLNESLWRRHVSPAMMKKINEECIRLFGIPQACEQIPYPEDWASLAGRAGFELEKMTSLTVVSRAPALPFVSAALRSRLFTLAGKLGVRFIGPLRLLAGQFRAAERSFDRYGPFLEGFFFAFRKPG